MVRHPIAIAFMVEDALGNRVDGMGQFGTVEETLRFVRTTIRQLNKPAKHGRRKRVTPKA